MRQAFGRTNMSSGELNQLAKQEAIRRWQRRPSDTGSGEVQVAIFTDRIMRLSRHMAAHHKDKSTKRRLQMLVLQRNRMLKYLRREQRERYTAVIAGLSIRPNRNFDPTIKPNRSSWSAARKKKVKRKVVKKPYGLEKTAKGRTQLKRDATRQRRLQRERDAAAKEEARAVRAAQQQAAS